MQTKKIINTQYYLYFLEIRAKIFNIKQTIYFYYSDELITDEYATCLYTIINKVYFIKRYISPDVYFS